MNDDLLRALAHELSTDTADCPTLLDRVAAGVTTRRRRQRTVAGALAAVAVVVAAPVSVLASHSGDRGATSRVEAGCSVHTSGCGFVLSTRAEQALRRANSLDFTGSRLVVDEPSCAHRAYCRGPV